MVRIIWIYQPAVRRYVMSYAFISGFRLALPHIDKLRARVKGAWVGREAREVLSDHLRFVPALELQQAFALNRVLVNGTPVDPSYHLSLGQTVEMIFHRHEPEVLDKPIRILHINEYFVVVNKPASVPVHPIGRFKKNTVVEILREEHPELVADGKELKVGHRLDRHVSGVLILARSSVAAAKLQKYFIQNFLEKEYLARVKGIFPEGVLEVCQPIGMIRDDPPLYGVCKQGKRAHTKFVRESVSPDGTESIVHCRPVTGRSHQIRVHLHWLGYPIVNDYKYGGILDHRKDPSSIPEPESYVKMDWCRECQQGKRDLSRVAQEDRGVYSIWLHALCYTNTHPFYPWRFEAPRPTWANFSHGH